MWDGKAREGYNRCPHTHTLPNIYIDFCFTRDYGERRTCPPTRKLTTPHVCRCTSALDHVQENTHILYSMLISVWHTHALARSLAPPQLHPSRTIWTLFCQLLQCKALWDEMLVFVFIFHACARGEDSAFNLKYIMFCYTTIAATSCRSSHCASAMCSVYACISYIHKVVKSLNFTSFSMILELAGGLLLRREGTVIQTENPELCDLHREFLNASPEK